MTEDSNSGLFLSSLLASRSLPFFVVLLFFNVSGCGPARARCAVSSESCNSNEPFPSRGLGPAVFPARAFNRTEVAEMR